MAWAAAIPAAMSVISSLSNMGGQGGGGGQQQQQAAPMLPPNPFPMNFPDGGKKTPSILDMMQGMQGMNPGTQPQQQDDQGNFMVPGGGKPLSVVDAFLPGGTSPSIFNPIQDPLQAGLGGLIKGWFK